MGVAELAVLAGIAGLAAFRIRQLLLESWTGAPARLAEAILGLSLLLVSAQGVGIMGALTSVGLAIGLMVVSLASVWAAGRSRAWISVRPPTDGPEASRPAAWAAVACAGVTLLHWSGPVQQSLDVGMYKQDTVWYHLPLAASFVQEASITGLHFTDPLKVLAWFFPLNSELVHSVGILAFGTDFISPFINLGWVVVALLAAWCIGRPFGSGLASVLGSALVLNSEIMLAQAGNAPSDTAGFALLLTVIAILVNSTVAGEVTRLDLPLAPLAVAGFAAGLAAGTKITLLPALGALAVLLIAFAKPGRRGATALALLAPATLTGGYWYMRNLVASGNPLPWVELWPLPTPNQLDIFPRAPHSVADYIREPETWVDRFVPGLNASLGEAWPLILIAAAAGLLTAVLRPGPRINLALGVAGIVSAAAYFFLPIGASGTFGDPDGFETNIRYLGPAILIGLSLLSISVRGRRLAGLTGVFSLALAVTLVSSSNWAADWLPGAAVVTTLLLAAPIYAFLPREGRPSSIAFAAGAAGLLLAVWLGYRAEQGYEDGRYDGSSVPLAANPGFRLLPEWRGLEAWARDQDDVRIALAGPTAVFGQYVFFGPGISNEVQYIGERGPHGSYRPVLNCRAWRSALAQGSYEFVVITQALIRQAGPGAPEALWLRGDPAAKEIRNFGPASVYEIDGRLNPAGCDEATIPDLPPVPGGGFGVPGSELQAPDSAEDQEEEFEEPGRTLPTIDPR